MFLVMLDALPHLKAEAQLAMSQAVQQGYLTARNPDDAHVRRAGAMLIEEAFPVTYTRSGSARAVDLARLEAPGDRDGWTKHGSLWLAGG